MNAMSPGPIATAGAAAGARVRSVSRSHVGRIRSINEDRILDHAAAGLWAVADGMGGHRGGDLAAQAVVDELRRLAVDSTAIDVAGVRSALSRANAAIVNRNRELGLEAGATVVVAVLDERTVHIGWAGDSRAYRLRAGGAELLTRDHSVVQELVTAGLLTADLAERHPQANVVTRALGVADPVEPEWVTVELAASDRLLLCSDGLSRSLRDGDCDPQAAIDQAADAMLDYALQRDGTDNISLVIVERAADRAGFSKVGCPTSA